MESKNVMTCQNGKVQTASESVDELRKAFILKKNTTGMRLNDVCSKLQTRIKRIVRPGNVMFILNSKNEKAEPLKCYVSNCSKIPYVQPQTIYSWN
jgi:hypothetical protein